MFMNEECWYWGKYPDCPIPKQFKDCMTPYQAIYFLKSEIDKLKEGGGSADVTALEKRLNALVGEVGSISTLLNDTNRAAKANTEAITKLSKEMQTLSADISNVKTTIEKKLNKNLGAINKGKVLSIDTNGDIVPSDIKTGGVTIGEVNNAIDAKTAPISTKVQHNTDDITSINQHISELETGKVDTMAMNQAITKATKPISDNVTTNTASIGTLTDTVNHNKNDITAINGSIGELNVSVGDLQGEVATKIDISQPTAEVGDVLTIDAQKNVVPKKPTGGGGGGLPKVKANAGAYSEGPIFLAYSNTFGVCENAGAFSCSISSDREGYQYAILKNFQVRAQLTYKDSSGEKTVPITEMRVCGLYDETNTSNYSRFIYNGVVIIKTATFTFPAVVYSEKDGLHILPTETLAEGIEGKITIPAQVLPHKSYSEITPGKDNKVAKRLNKYREFVFC